MTISTIRSPGHGNQFRLLIGLRTAGINLLVATLAPRCVKCIGGWYFCRVRGARYSASCPIRRDLIGIGWSSKPFDVSLSLNACSVVPS